MARNVLGEELAVCGLDPVTGWMRTGCCETDAHDVGSHTVCVVMTDDFLEFSAARGNDLSTPRPGFAGLQAGDRWCLCASRFKEALDAGVAPQVIVEACEERALDDVPLAALRAHAFD
ncbi:MAG: DUF2237 domain-containing protein [Solirubrobacteraceae bacterium]